MSIPEYSEKNKWMKQLLISHTTVFKGWVEEKILDDFSCPWSKENLPRTGFRAFHDNVYLHFRFDAWGTAPLIYVQDNNKMEVLLSERVEIFFRGNEKMQPYYGLEIDPYGRVLDYKANYYRNFDYDWQWPENLHINSGIGKESYYVEGKISFSTLKQVGLLNNNQIQVGLYRGHCTEIAGEKTLFKWISWVDPQTPKPDFHVPSSFGSFMLQE